MGLYKQKNSRYWWMSFWINKRRIHESTKTTNKKRAEIIYAKRYSELLEELKGKSRLETYLAVQQQKEKERGYLFEELTTRYIEFIEGRLKSCYNLKGFIKKLSERFKNRTLDSFTMQDLELLQNDWIKRGLSIAYANRLTATLKRMFTKAADWEMTNEGVLKRIRKAKQLKGETKRLKYLTEEEAQRLINHSDRFLKPIVATALNTGMRKSEILDLSWDRVDLKNRIILLDKTKNGERREIPVNQTLYDTLLQLPRHISGYVFANPKTGKPYNNVKKSFGTALRKSHILDFRFHDLRHTFASWLVMKGVDLTTIKELLGHKDIKMTLRSSHLAPSHIRNAVENLCYSFVIEEEIKNYKKL